MKKMLMLILAFAAIVFFSGCSKFFVPGRAWQFDKNDDFESYGIQKIAVYVTSNSQKFLKARGGFFMATVWMSEEEYPGRIYLGNKYPRQKDALKGISKDIAVEIRRKLEAKGYKVTILDEKPDKTVGQIIESAAKSGWDAVFFVAYNPYSRFQVLLDTSYSSSYIGLSSYRTAEASFFDLKGLLILPSIRVIDTKTKAALWSFRNYGVVGLDSNRASASLEHPIFNMSSYSKEDIDLNDEIFADAVKKVVDEVFKPKFYWKDSNAGGSYVYKEFPDENPIERSITAAAAAEYLPGGFRDNTCMRIDDYDGFFIKAGWAVTLPLIGLDGVWGFSQLDKTAPAVARSELPFALPGGIYINFGITLDKLMIDMGVIGNATAPINILKDYPSEYGGTSTMYIKEVSYGGFDNSYSWMLPFSENIAPYIGGGYTMFSCRYYGDYIETNEDRDMIFGFGLYLQPGIQFKFGSFLLDAKLKAILIPLNFISAIACGGVMF